MWLTITVTTLPTGKVVEGLTASNVDLKGRVRALNLALEGSGSELAREARRREDADRELEEAIAKLRVAEGERDESERRQREPVRSLPVATSSQSA